MLTSIFRSLLYRMGVTLKPVPKKHFFSGKKSNETTIGKYSITTNKDHTLSFNIKTHPLYNLNLPRLIKFLSISTPNMSVIDIGANIGDTVAYIRNESNAPIFCFEADEYYFEVLKKNTAQFDNVTLFKQYLSDSSATMNIKKSFSGGTASLTNAQEGTDTIVLKTLDEVISNEPALFDTVKVIKIDTDGFDTKIIRGSWNFLQSHKPVLFFEYDLVFLAAQKEQGLDTLKKLATIGYHRVFFYDNHGRFIVSLTLNNIDDIECLHNYIKNYEAPFEFYDLCIFHSDDEAKALEFLALEKNLNNQKGK